MLVYKTTGKKHTLFKSSLLLVFLNSACVSTHYGHEYGFAENQLVISCSKDHSISHAQIKSISCAFENTGSSWLDVKVSKFQPHPHDGVKALVVLPPERIESFITAYKFQVAKTEHNTGLLLAGLVLGSAVASNSGNPGVSAATLGGAVALGSYVGARDAYNEGNVPILKYGAAHILGPSFELPPKSFVRKKLLIESFAPNPMFAWPKTIELCLVGSAAGGSEQDCRDMKFWNVRD